LYVFLCTLGISFPPIPAFEKEEAGASSFIIFHFIFMAIISQVFHTEALTFFV